MDRSAAEDALPGQLTLFDEPAPPGETAGARRVLRLGARIVEYRTTRSRRRTIGISVDATGLAVRAPLRVPWREIEGFLHDKRRWILAKLDEWAAAGRRQALFGASGESLPLFGRPVVLEITAGRASVAHCDRSVRIVCPEPHRRGAVRELLVQWLKERALEALAPRAAHYAALLGLEAPHVAISNASTQWGVCTAGGAIRLSWRLAHFAPALSDYVVAHEVAHLVELNHSRRFWNLLETLYPEWRAAREALELGAASLPLL
jgi:predicted metal-dependent hydrolase